MMWVNGFDHSERKHKSEVHMQPKDLDYDSVGCQSYMRYEFFFDMVPYTESTYSQTPTSYGCIEALVVDGRCRVGFQ